MYGITASEVKGMIGRINLIDIRDNYLYNLGSIPTAKNVPINFLLSNPDMYIDKNSTYYIYCSYGMQSAKVCNILNNKGYKVINLLGGYNEYSSK